MPHLFRMEKMLDGVIYLARGYSRVFINKKYAVFHRGNYIISHMESIRKVLGELRNDDFRYGLLDDGDKIVVGISPNIASLTFLSVLFDYSIFQFLYTE